MDKLGTLFSVKKKKKELLSHEKTWRDHKCILRSERSRSEKAIYCLIPDYMTFRERQNHKDSKKIGGWQRLRERKGGVGGARRHFRAMKLLGVIL